jgi:hypothetical protein
MSNGEIDFSSIWSWTLPLWGLFVIVLFLGGILTQETTILALPAVPAMSGGGGARRLTKKHT